MAPASVVSVGEVVEMATVMPDVGRRGAAVVCPVAWRGATACSGVSAPDQSGISREYLSDGGRGCRGRGLWHPCDDDAAPAGPDGGNAGGVGLGGIAGFGRCAKAGFRRRTSQVSPENT